MSLYAAHSRHAGDSRPSVVGSNPDVSVDQPDGDYHPGCVKRSRAKTFQIVFRFLLARRMSRALLGRHVSEIETEILHAREACAFSHDQDPKRTLSIKGGSNENQRDWALSIWSTSATNSSIRNFVLSALA